MAIIYDFPIPKKCSWEAERSFWLNILKEDRFDPAIAEAAIDAFRGPWETLMQLPSLHVETDKINLSGIPRERADSFFDEIYRLCNEGVNRFAYDMAIVHKKVFYASLLIYALELSRLNK